MTELGGGPLETASVSLPVGGSSRIPTIPRGSKKRRKPRKARILEAHMAKSHHKVLQARLPA